MIAAVLLTLVVFAMATTLQYHALHGTSLLVHPSQGSARAVTIAVTLLSTAHLVQGALYAGGIWIGNNWLGLGELKPSTAGKSVTFIDHFYFSLINLSTLGRGPLTPTGDLRLITAVEALHGFMLITSSGTYMFQLSAGKAPFARDS